MNTAINPEGYFLLTIGAGVVVGLLLAALMVRKRTSFGWRVVGKRLLMLVALPVLLYLSVVQGAFGNKANPAWYEYAYNGVLLALLIYAVIAFLTSLIVSIAYAGTPPGEESQT